MSGVWAKIVVGGALTRSHLRALVRALQDDGEYDYDDLDLESVAADTSCLYADGDASGSEFETTRNFCVSHDLVYYLQVDGGSSTAPIEEFWRPGMDQPYWRYTHDDVMAVSDLVEAFRVGKTLAEVIADSIPPRDCNQQDVPPLILMDQPIRDDVYQRVAGAISTLKGTE